MKPYLMVAPAVIVVGLLFFAGIWEALKQSLGWFELTGETHLHLQNYVMLLQSAEFWQSAMLSFRVALISTVVSGLLGTALAVWLFDKTTHRQNWYALPMLFPHLSAAYIVMLWWMQSGIVSRIAYFFGLIEEPSAFPVVVFDEFGWGMILSYVWKETPFFVLMLYPVLHRMRAEWFEVTRVYGGGRWQHLRHIVLPLLTPAIAVSSLIVFAFAFTAYEIPYLLGVTYPKSLPVYIFEWYQKDVTARPLAMAAALLMVLFLLVPAWIVYMLARRVMRATKRGWA